METEDVKARKLFADLYFVQAIAKYAAIQIVRKRYKSVDIQDLLCCAVELENCYS